jgi:thymidylate kinase
MTSIALVGIDGAGKSTIASAVAARLGVPARVVYMGVNVETSSLMLPTTRLLLALKQRRGGRPDMVANFGRDCRGVRASVVTAGRLAVWVSEEWFRQAVALWHQARGRVVIFDRHFAADERADDAALSRGGRSSCWAARLHEFVLDRLYPRPDLIVALDGPAATLLARKTEADDTDVDTLEARRRAYLDLARTTPGSAVVDATGPLDDVVAVVTATIQSFLAGRAATRTVRPSQEQGTVQ